MRGGGVGAGDAAHDGEVEAGFGDAGDGVVDVVQVDVGSGAGREGFDGAARPRVGQLPAEAQPQPSVSGGVAQGVIEIGQDALGVGDELCPGSGECDIVLSG